MSRDLAGGLEKSSDDDHRDRRVPRLTEREREQPKLPRDVARYILKLTISDQDKARMHDLAVRNQHGALTPGEREELFGFAKATSLLSILKSKARRTLGIKLKSRSIS